MPRPYPLRTALVAALCAVLASCGGSSRGPDYAGAPSNQNDLCAIFDQRPGWREAVEASASKWGAPVAVQMAIMWRESSFRADVRPPTKYTLGVIPAGPVSSAYGYAQAIDGTWDWYRDATGQDDADRTVFEDAADFVGWYMSRSNAANGIDMWDAYNQYLAYHEGHAGHRRGSYNAKDWLLGVADRVADQAVLYNAQYRGC
ncbi:MAG: transglycosylase SLT domain-containing protein [Pseudomonadota bacterium]